MTDDGVRTGERCAECGTPLEVAEVAEDATPDEGATLTLRCANGHARTVHRHADGEGGGRAAEL